jgi:hypothetical protein
MEEKIYFLEGEKAENTKELLINGYGIYYKFQPTFFDPECTKQQCDYARRSFGDLLNICTTYFPETTEMDLMRVLIDLFKSQKIRGLYCNDIGKPVFIKDTYFSNDFIDITLLDKYPDTELAGYLYSTEYLNTLKDIVSL